MLSPQHQAYEQLVGRIAPHSRLRHAWQLSGGISAGMIALEFERPDGQRSKVIVRRPGESALRRNPNAAGDESRTLQITRSLGLPTPAAHEFDDVGTLLGGPYLVVEYLEGAPSFAPHQPSSVIVQLAEQLAAIHRADHSQHDVSFLRAEPQRFAEIFGERGSAVDRLPDEGRLRRILEPNWPIPQRSRLALLHGDYWPGNILWRDGTLVAVIDWEDAHLGDPLADLAISRLDMAWIFGIDAMQSFTEHYRSSMPADYTYLPYWDLYAALRLARLAGDDLAAWAAFFERFGRHDITEQTIREQYHWFITQAFEKLSHEK